MSVGLINLEWRKGAEKEKPGGRAKALKSKSLPARRDQKGFQVACGVNFR